jgi:cytochrome oxidase Cu insertion factor (SCO1/SenC/PrrC family)
LSLEAPGILGTVLSWAGLILLLLLAYPACSAGSPPAGEPIDLEAFREFKPFQLKEISGEDRQLSDYLDKVTLVSFFFPT